MRPLSLAALALSAAAALGCASGRRADVTAHPAGVAAADGAATLAQIYFWRAKPGKLEEYTRYVRDVAEPIDEEAKRAGAFVSVTTYLAADTALAWTHMRVFLLRDSTQLRGLSAALSAAGARLQPDSVKRRVQGEYSATLRDRVGATVAQIVR